MGNYGVPLIFQRVTDQPYHDGASINLISYYATLMRDGKSSGLRMSGVGNLTYGDTEGFFGGGLFNSCYGNHKGADITAAINYVSTNAKGFYFAGLGTIIEHGTLEGIAIAGVGNAVVDNDSKGVFLSGITNFSKGNARGVYVAGVCNILDQSHDNDSCSGVNIAAVNYAKRAGNILFQFGLYNHIKEVPQGCKVIQVGLYNRAENSSSVFLNFKNIFKKRRTQRTTLESRITPEVSNE